jgi:threonine/homoserine/homoserine lactone efflux protein
MDVDKVIAAVMFAGVMSMTPGPNNMLLVASGMSHGVRKTLPAIAGVVSGFLLLLLGAGLGTGQVFALFPAASTVLKWCAVAYLLWLAYGLATAPTDDRIVASARPLSPFETFAVQMINPKAWATCIGAVASYTAPQAYWSSFAVIFAIFCVATPLSALTWTLFGERLRAILRTPRRRRAFNVTMAAGLIVSLIPIAIG